MTEGITIVVGAAVWPPALLPKAFGRRAAGNHPSADGLPPQPGRGEARSHSRGGGNLDKHIAGR
jgi:hypothetical protein